MARTPLRYTSTGVPLAAVPPAAVPLPAVPLAPAALSVVPDTAEVGPRAVPQWWRGPDPDPVLVRRLLVDERRTEREVAGVLGVSRERLAAVLTGLGLERGQRAHKRCPVDDAELRRLVEQGEGASSLARRFGVAWATSYRPAAGQVRTTAQAGESPACACAPRSTTT